MAEQLSFNLGNARDYLREMHKLGQKRDDINAQMNGVRKLARQAGTPVTTLEALYVLRGEAIDLTDPTLRQCITCHPDLEEKVYGTQP